MMYLKKSYFCVYFLSTHFLRFHRRMYLQHKKSKTGFHFSSVAFLNIKSVQSV